jgi:multidrug efflux pump subunit AcrB
MFVLLVTQFNSFYQSGLILLAVIMSTAGVLLGLLVTGRPLQRDSFRESASSPSPASW